MKLLKKLMFLPLGLFLLVSPSCKKEEIRPHFVKLHNTHIKIYCKHQALDDIDKVIGRRVDKIFPPDSDVGYPAYSADINNDESEDLIVPSPYNYFTIINDYYSVLHNMENYKIMFKERMKRNKIIRKNGRIVRNVPLSDYLDIYNVTEFRYHVNNIFADIDGDKLIEMTFKDDRSIQIYKWKKIKYEKFFGIDETGPSEDGTFPVTTKDIVFYDFDGDGYFEIFKDYESRYSPFGIFESRPFICYMDFYEIRNGKIKRYKMRYMPRNESLGDYEEGPVSGDTWYAYGLRDRIQKSRYLAQAQKTKIINYFDKITKYKFQ